MNSISSSGVNKKFIELIDDYVLDLRRFYTQLSAAAAVDEIDQWQIKGFPYPRGVIPSKPDIYYSFHGDDPGGLKITIGHQQMDIIFGHFQRIDGFDAEHLLIYLENRPGKYVDALSQEAVGQLFDEAVDAGVIRQLFADDGDYNYYKTPVLNS